ncbi:MAG: filamentous hemagglutinin N-terminal domain-containing protein [Cyanobacteria bacterium P01_A01_bin.114]
MQTCSLSSLFRLCTLVALIGWPLPGVCQVSADSTLSTDVTTADSLNFVIEAGDRAGDNLFHSFEQFSIPTGGSAYFDQPFEIQNIISRVTGNRVSDIDGALRANGTATVFLINPNGIVFGPNASLDIGGSFVGTTAQQLRFADGTELDARDSSAVPQLTISRPLGLQMTAASGAIVVLGDGHGLAILPPDFEVNRTFRTAGLQVGPDQTLALVGNNLSLRGGNLTTPGGRVDLGSVSEGEVRLSNETALALDYAANNRFADIQLTESASVDTAGAGGGDIQLQGRRIEIVDGSGVLSDTLGATPGGTLTIRAIETLSVGGGTPEMSFATGIYADTGLAATARGSDIVIEAGRLRAFDGGSIAAGGFGAADNGDLIIRADQIEAVGAVPGTDSTTLIGNFGAFTSTGAGGDLLIQTRRLRVADGAQVTAGSFGPSRAGDLIVNANIIELVGADSLSGDAASGLYTAVESNVSEGAVGGNLIINADQLRLADTAIISAAMATAGAGQAGNIEIDTAVLSLVSGAQIVTLTRGQGDAGDLRVRADEIDIEGFGVTPEGTTFFSGISASVVSPTASSGGDIRIVTNRLFVSNGGFIESATEGAGDAGDIDILAREVTLTGQSPAMVGVRSFPSSISTQTFSTGAAGNVRIVTDEFTATEGAVVTVSSDLTGGASGNLDLTARLVQLTDGGSLLAESAAGDRGSINLQVGDLLLLNNGGQITTDATGTATGGNIDIDGGLIFLNQGSEIVARAIAGPGGNIQLTSEQILISDDSLIDTRSNLGVDGTVSIERLTPEAEANPVALPDAVLTPDRLVANSCLAAGERGVGQFVISGRGGLVPSPNDLAQATFETYHIPTPAEVSGSSPQGADVSPVGITAGTTAGTIAGITAGTISGTITEAQGAYRLVDGRVRLAHLPAPSSNCR